MAMSHFKVTLQVLIPAINLFCRVHFFVYEFNFQYLFLFYNIKHLVRGVQFIG